MKKEYFWSLMCMIGMMFIFLLFVIYNTYTSSLSFYGKLIAIECYVFTELTLLYVLYNAKKFKDENEIL